MELNYNEETYLVDPSKEDIENIFEKLDPEEFIILDKDEDYYLQLYLHDDGALQIEYRDGSHNEHYELDESQLESSDVIVMFCKYAADDPAWKDMVKWKKMDMDEEFEWSEDE